MATTQQKTSATDSYEKAAERVTAFNERVLEQGKAASAAYLDAYEKAVLGFADTYERAAAATNVEWVVKGAATQADLTRELTKAGTSAARQLV